MTSMLGCWSDASSYDDFPKSADMVRTCDINVYVCVCVCMYVCVRVCVYVYVYVYVHVCMSVPSTVEEDFSHFHLYPYYPYFILFCVSVNLTATSLGWCVSISLQSLEL